MFCSPSTSPRAASSIVANIAEGEGSRWGKEGIALTRIVSAKGSLYETLAWLDIALVEKLVGREEVSDIQAKLVKLEVSLQKQLEEIDEKRSNIVNTTSGRAAASQEYWAEKAKGRGRTT